MKKIYKLSLAVLAIVSAPTLAQQAVDIKAKTPNSAYVQDSRGVVVRNAYGSCWRTGYWTPAEALPECEGGVAKMDQSPKTAKLAKVSYDADAFFDFDKSKLKHGGKASLDKLAKDMKGDDVQVIIATGHTDSTGTQAYNQALSERRAEAVKAYLIKKGVDGKKIVAKGKGEKQPVADNVTEEGRAENRHVIVIEVLRKEK
jgi:OmpA-OmpF porin, OOP family